MYSWASDTMPLTDWSRPWFCISMADRRPARWAPAEIPIPSSSLARRTRIIAGVVLGQADEVDQPGLGQGRDDLDPDRGQRVVDQLGVALGDRHG